MPAVNRRDVASLNEEARIQLRNHGLLGPDSGWVGDTPIATGDEVLCLRNDRRLGVLNGTWGRVVGMAEGSVIF